MDPIIFTPRLKLSLVTKAERGSPELEWLHEVRSNEQSTWWSIYRQAKSIEDTEKAIKIYLPTIEGDEKKYRVVYAVHKILESTNGSVEGESQPADQGEKPTQFIGIVTLRSLDDTQLVFPDHLTIPAAEATTTLIVDIGYMFLPIGWGKGYATESLEAAFGAYKRAPSFWSPFSKVYVRGAVNDDNAASQRVMEKVGMAKRGIYEWTGKPVFFAGKWRERENLHVFGRHLLD